jgi:hypothetical protein
MKSRKRVRTSLVLLVLSLTLLSFGRSQEAAVEEWKKTALKVFVDCGFCDLEYIKTEITFHVLFSLQSTGSGGREYTLTFLGQREFAGEEDVLRYYSHKTDTDESIRLGLVQTLKLGLMRYVAKTPISQRISISLKDEVKPTAVVDRWNFWVFSLSAYGFFNGQKSVTYNSIYGNLSANRVTPEFKLRISAAASHYFNKYDLDGESIESTMNNRFFNALGVKSMGEHWSLGGYFSLSSSSYSNIRFAIQAAPAVEFNIFPYSQSTRRQLRFLYKLNVSAVRYLEETIYLKTEENLWSQDLSMTLEMKEKWGTIGTSLEGSHYLHDRRKYHLRLNSEVSLRLYRGLSFNLYGSISRIHDQLSLPRGGASLEDILLMRKQLATSYEYYCSIGLSYTFGSIFSNVVNPRFGSGGEFVSETY